MLPTFVGIGAQRAGTTWLHHCLAEHPQVCTPHVRKEVHFFNSNFERGPAWYEAQFRVTPVHKAVGEISPNYLNSEVAMTRMAATVPQARLLVIFRNPVDRAFSAYQLYHERYKGVSFREACTTAGNIVKFSLYADSLARVSALFPKEQIGIYLYDDLARTPKKFVQSVFRFIGVDDAFVPPSLQRTYNRVVYPGAQRWITRAGLRPALEWFKKSSAGEWLKRAHAGGGQKGTPQLDDADREFARQYFRDDILRLQTMIDRDLSAWL
jgi:hypothetical protein